MKFEFCPKCGMQLAEKEIGDEGLVPFCQKCERPWFSFAYPCVICLVINEKNEIALIKQSYGTDRYVCVAGYIKQGESAEMCAKREIKEEIGLDVAETKYIKSYSYQKRDNLMLGFVCRVNNNDFRLSSEVDKATWFTPEDADEKLKNANIAHQLLNDVLKERSSINDYR